MHRGARGDAPDQAAGTRRVQPVAVATGKTDAAQTRRVRRTIRVCLSDAHRASKVRRVATATADHPLLIGGERVETGEWTDVRSPYSGELVGRIARGGATETRRALDAAEAALRAPLPAHRRAAILDATARLLEERQEEAAQVISAEAGKPLKAARIEAQRAASTYIFAAVEARKLAGDVVPMDASPAGEGKLAITLRVPIGVVGAISPVQLPAEPRRAQDRAGARRRLPRRPQAGDDDTALGALPRRARGGGGPAAGLAERRLRSSLRDRRRARRGRAREADHVHRLGRGGLGNRRARASQAREAGARKRDARHRVRGRAGRYGRRSSPRTPSRSQGRAASPCSASSSLAVPRGTRSSRSSCRRSKRSSVGDPADEATDVGPVISDGTATGSSSGSASRRARC